MSLSNMFIGGWALIIAAFFLARSSYLWGSRAQNYASWIFALAAGVGGGMILYAIFGLIDQLTKALSLQGGL